MKRPKPTIDNRPSWRDPNLPALFNATDQITGRQYMIELNPDKATKAFVKRMEAGNAPTYQNDPTYNLRRRK